MGPTDIWEEIFPGKGDKSKDSKVGIYLSPHMTPLALQDQGKQMHLQEKGRCRVTWPACTPRHLGQMAKTRADRYLLI